MMESTRVYIIGGGLSGLFLAAFLAKAGKRVVVLEKNAVPGGGLQCFKRNAVLEDGSTITYTFETGMHIMGGFQPGGFLHKLCEEWGILDELQLQPMPADCMDQVCVDGHLYSIPLTRPAQEQYYASLFPAEKEGIHRYYDTTEQIVDSIPMFKRNDEESTNMSTPALEEYISLSASDLVERCVGHPVLRILLAHHNPMYAGRRGKSPAYQHALLGTVFMEGSQMFVGGSQQLASALVRLIERHGGSVLTSHRVSHLDVVEHKVTRLHLASASPSLGKVVDLQHDDNVVSSVHPKLLLSMVDAGLPHAFTSRIWGSPDTYSCFITFVGLEPGKVPILPAPRYVFLDDRVWNPDLSAGWPHGYVLFTPPAHPGDTFATTLLIISPMQWSQVVAWQDTKFGHRPDSYKAWKEQRQLQLCEQIEMQIPGISRHIRYVESSSPLSIRHWYGNPCGSMFGLQRDVTQPLLTQISPRTKVHNLYLTGQNISMHGICGTPMAALMTAQMIQRVEKYTNQ